MTDILKYALRFIVLVLVQVLILNNINFLGFINPYLYVAFILTLPMSVPKGYLYIIAFLLGASIDIFTQTPGMHAFATLTMSFFRTSLFKLFAPHDDNYEQIIPSMNSFGVNHFIYYASMMVLIHHIALFTIDAFSFHHFAYTLLLILTNTIATLLLLLGIERITFRK